MAFGLYIPPSGGGGGGGGGGGPTVVTLNTGDIDPTDAVDLDVPLGAGETAAAIEAITVTRTAGTATTAALSLWNNDARNAPWGNDGYIFGDSFGVTVDPGPVAGPQIKFPGGSAVPLQIPYGNEDGSSFIRLTFHNADFVNNGSWDVKVAFHGLEV